jgi:enolase
MNVINGGEHAGNSLDIQEHMILPTGAGSYAEALQMGAETYHTLGKLLARKYGKGATNVGDEGGFAPPIENPEEPFSLILEAIEECGYTGKIGIGTDAAASEFYDVDSKTYSVAGKKYSSGELVDFYRELAEKFDIVSMEDPFHEDDWDGFRELTKAIGDRVQIVGDDLYVTNMERLGRGIREKVSNGLLLKVNQIGTVTEAIDAATMAHRAGFGVMVSHRSGETEDTFISDLTVAINAGQLKSGAPARGERTAKYNQLLRIEEYLGSEGYYAGANFVNPFRGV